MGIEKDTTYCTKDYCLDQLLNKVLQLVIYERLNHIIKVVLSALRNLQIYRQTPFCFLKEKEFADVATQGGA